MLSKCKNCSQKNINVTFNISGVCEICSLKIESYNRYYWSNIPIDYWHFNMNDFSGPKILQDVYLKAVKDIPNLYSKGLSFSLLGKNGVGKTTVGVSIVKRMAEKNYICLYTTLNDMIAALIEAPFDEKLLIKKDLMQTDFLVIDELDSRFFAATENTSDLFAKNLENIIRTRFSNKLPNIFISNSPNMLEGFKGAFKDSLGSLMSGVKEYVAIGKDFRKELSKETNE